MGSPVYGRSHLPTIHPVLAVAVQGQTFKMCSRCTGTQNIGAATTEIPIRQVPIPANNYAAVQDELQRAGFGEVRLPGPACGDLPPGIHPILAPENWIREDFYCKPNNSLLAELQPALRLVTKLLTTQSVVGW